jgi:hypothetical protein
VGALQLIKFLVDHGAKIDARDGKGQTPYSLAEDGAIGAGVKHYEKEAAALLRQLGANTSLGRSTSTNAIQ